MKVLIKIGILTLLAHANFAQQTDSTRINYSQETDSLKTKPASRLIRAVYRRFVRAQIEEKTLIKIGAIPLAISRNANGDTGWGFRSEVAAEQKLTPAVSVLIAAQPYYRTFSALANEWAIGGVLGSRWYFNMNRRIRQRKGANNFSSQYLLVQAGRPIWSEINSNDPKFTVMGGYEFTRWIGVGVGAQRRLGKFGYLDTNISANYSSNQPRPVTLRLSFLVGLGL